MRTPAESGRSSMTSIFEGVRKILADKYSVEEESVTPESTLKDLGLDSLDLVELIFEVEDVFDIRVPQDAGTELLTATVQDIVDDIQKLAGQSGPARVASG